MKFTSMFVGLSLSALLAPAVAQHHHAEHGATQGPYAGMQTRTIKALSDQEIADLRAGKGMGMAMPAELNGYPGPSHVLQLAEQLQLSEAQASQTKALLQQMQQEARAAGEALINAESELDALFKNKQATPALLAQANAKSAAARGQLRETHLRYHLRMMEVLTPEQVSLYNRLRGY